MLRTLEKKKDIFESLPAGDRSILWLTDSTNMVAFLSKGSTKKDIQVQKSRFFTSVGMTRGQGIIRVIVATFF